MEQRKLGLVQGRKMEPLEALFTNYTEIQYAAGTRKTHLMMAIVDVDNEYRRIDHAPR
ncbi:hypothetical protein LM599_05485 [Candidatus Acetothermia bacterium]|jgi:hypothetical protein|nr:hypothetical protein [Candidatus Acetothermia bacterium]MCI2427021.1 hypothetical protein [Candidatus Acetothermia bacterium]MCI2428128.1 hypothetical protein [Candidatus Acetothermia bacterium]